MRSLFVGQKEQQIDIRERRQLAAAIAADRDNRQLFAGGRIAERIDRLGDKVVEHPDQLIDQKRLLPDHPDRGAIGLEPAANLGATLRQRRLERRQQRTAVERGRRRVGDRLHQRFAERPPVDDVALPQDVGHYPLRGAARHRRK